jgi:hypothetical protein
MGVGQAASAIGGYQSQVAATDARNKQIANDYNQRKSLYQKSELDRVNAYSTALVDVGIAQDEAALAASQAGGEIDLQEIEALSQILQAEQDAQLKRMIGTGKAAEGGRARSYGANQERAIGRQEGNLLAAREDLSVKAFIERRKAVEKAEVARIKYWRQVNMGAGLAAPAPAMPEFLKGPNPMALVGQLALTTVGAMASAGVFSGGSSAASAGSGAASAGTVGATQQTVNTINTTAPHISTQGFSAYTGAIG